MNTNRNKSRIECKTSKGLIDYKKTLLAMEARVAEINAGSQEELLWFVEHPPLYTAGTNSNSSDLLNQNRFPVHQVGRGLSLIHI